MRILILVDCFLPSVNSGAKQTHDLAVEFHRFGHDVTVLTTAERAPGGMGVSLEDGLRVVRVGTGMVKHRWRPLRALREARLSTTLWSKAHDVLLGHACDLIVFYSPTIFFGSLVHRLKCVWKCPAYLILRDIFPQWAVDTGALRKGFAYAYFRKKEFEQYAAADIIAVQTRGDLRYFANQIPHNHYSLEVLYNWTSLSESDLPRTNYRAQLGLQEKVVFVYGGNLGAAQDMYNIVRLASSLADQDHIHFLLVGEGSEAVSLRRKIASRALRNIQVLPSVEQREYLSMIAEFDVGIVTLDRHLSTHNIPGKILSYFYWGLPVLASINPDNDLFDIVTQNEVGYCLMNGNDESLAAAARKLAEDRELRVRFGRNARRLLEDTFSVQRAATQILAHFEAKGGNCSSSGDRRYLLNATSVTCRTPGCGVAATQ